jgi:hypothetical protein
MFQIFQMNDSSKTCIGEVTTQLNKDLNQLHNKDENEIESVNESNGVEDKSYHCTADATDSRTTTSCELTDDNNDDYHNNPSSSQMVPIVTFFIQY